MVALISGDIVRTLTIADIDAITDVHCSAFPTAVLTALGRESVARYYRWQFQGSDRFYARGVFRGARLEGFCFGGIHPNAVSGFLTKNRLFLASRVLTHPWLLASPTFATRVKGAANAVFKTRPPARANACAPAAQPMGAAFDILAIAVRPKLQRSGVGSSLMSDAEALARSERFHAMTLSVHTDNMQAISFYEKLGWQKHSRPGTPWAGAMEKWLIPRPVVSAPLVEMPQVGV